MKIRLIIALSLIVNFASAIPVDFREAVQVNGISQWIEVKGADASQPVLLFLHGGPGNSATNYAGKFTDKLQQQFVVVMWDQRESGRTAGLNKSDQPLTLSLVTDDVIAMITYLQQRFAQDRIYLMGHSWGGFLALRAASSHPEMLRACFALAPMIYQQQSERESLQAMIARAEERSDNTALSELRTIHVPFENGEQLYFHRKWLSKMMGSGVPSKSVVIKWSAKWLSLFNEGSGINFFEEAPEIKCPVYFFVGSRDHQTSSKLTEAYFKAVKAEKKDLFWFTNSAHSLNLTEPTKLQEIVISLKATP